VNPSSRRPTTDEDLILYEPHGRQQLERSAVVFTLEQA
jgi:hypothetical protein